MTRAYCQDELLAVMCADAAEIESAPSTEELLRARAELDVDECHHVATQAYWNVFLHLSRRRDEGEHVRLCSLAALLESP